MSDGLDALLKLAKLREDQAIAQARRVADAARQISAFGQQIRDYANDYGRQMTESGSSGVSVAFLSDAAAFKSRLEAGASQQDLMLLEQTRRLDHLNRQAMAAKKRVEGVEKLIAKRKARERAHRDHKERLELEEALAARYKPPI